MTCIHIVATVLALLLLKNAIRMLISVNIDTTELRTLNMKFSLLTFLSTGGMDWGVSIFS